MCDISLRVAKESDAEKLLEIYKPYVLDTAISFECELPTAAEFRERIHNTLIRYPYLIAEKDGEAVGYAYAGAFKNREAYNYSVETTVYVKNDMKRCGVGKKLYLSLEAILGFQNILNLNACIGYTETEDEYLNNNSERFHRRLGYRLVGKFNKCGYKFGRWYDMIWMEKLLGDHKENPKPIKWFSEYRDELCKKTGILCD